jgi:hypothetical protein
MLAPSILLAVIGLLGAFDIFYFHHHVCGLTRRPEARVEAWIHVARGVVYALQLALVPAFRFGGAAYAAFVALFIVDILIAVADVVVEPDARRALGGLPRGEYLAHVVLSVLVGIYLCLVWRDSRGWSALPTAITYAPIAAAWPLRALLWLMAAGCTLMTVADVLVLVEARLPRPAPVQVAVGLACTLPDLWSVTQDHRLHPSWDHRFSTITMLDDIIATGTRMRYDKRVLGLTVRGFGRYKLHRPLRQSTFEFWSDDWRSFIRRGVGVWLYRPLPGGGVELSTAYGYDVRWGGIGRVLDRWLLRPLMQRATEQSFRRLARDHFPRIISPACNPRRKMARAVSIL